MNIKEIIDEESELPIESNYNILILDDALYTGTNTFNKIDIPIFKLSENFGLNQKDVESRFKFYIVIPFVAIEGYKFIMNEAKLRDVSCKIYNKDNLSGLKDLINISEFYPEDSEKILRDKFSISLNLDLPIADMPAIYFDNKVVKKSLKTFNLGIPKGFLGCSRKYI